MSKWSGKYVIGLTGNIATGKSVVRKMLEHLGAYGIDADALGHRAISKGAPGYRPVVETFGRWILTPEGEIDRARLGKVVFADPYALSLLESIVHPLVGQAIDVMVSRAGQRVVVIEAIKLLEAGLAKNCDAVWVSYAPPGVQLQRLMTNRKMDEASARTRINAQPPQEQKTAAATVVIKNIGSFEDTWRQVAAAWKKTVPAAAAAEADAQPAPEKTVSVKGELSIERGRPSHAADIAELITRLAGDGRKRTRDEIMAAFGEKAFLLLKLSGKPCGVIAWQVENLVARTTDVFVDPAVPVKEALPALFTEMERASKDLQCEASLLFARGDVAKNEALLKSLGYERRAPETLGVQAWQEAANESRLPDTILFFKQLRIDRVLRPI